MNKIHLLSVILMLSALIPCFAATETQPKLEPASETGIEGMISVSPVQGGPARQGAANSRPLANMAFVVKKGDRAIKSFQTDDQGRFRVLLEPGHYTVSRKDWKAALGSYGPFAVDVSKGRITNVQWNCDTGLR